VSDDTVPRATLIPSWSERYLGGSEAREADLLRAYAAQIQRVQRRNRRGDEQIRRGFHAKLLAGIATARFVVAENVRPELRVGLILPGASYPAMVRYSSASGVAASRSIKDLRGIAIRVQTGGERGDRVQDFLLSDTPTSHARDARQFMAAADAMAGGRRLTALPGLIGKLGPWEGVRVLRALRHASAQLIDSVATVPFFSRAPFAIGPYAVKFKLQPVAPPAERVGRLGHDELRRDLIERLRREAVRYELQVQHYVDDRTTPIEDGTVEWPEPGRPETLAELVIPRQDLASAEGQEGERLVEALEFSPWRTDGTIRPIGGLNRARKPVYEASARLRSGGSA